VSKVLWEDRGRNPDEIQVLAVGTTAIPNHLPKYHSMLENFYKRSAEYSAAAKSKGFLFKLNIKLNLL
jgi:hypothetical protein